MINNFESIIPNDITEQLGDYPVCDTLKMPTDNTLQLLTPDECRIYDQITGKKCVDIITKENYVNATDLEIKEYICKNPQTTLNDIIIPYRFYGLEEYLGNYSICDHKILAEHSGTCLLTIIFILVLNF